MNVIFAVTQFMKPIYDKLAEFLGQKNNVGELPKVENNIVSDTQGLQKLIVDQYNQIIGKHCIEILEKVRQLLSYFFKFIIITIIFFYF